jgi:integrase
MMDMRLEYPGLVIERQRSGAIRYRVRQIGDKARRTLLTVTPDHPDFHRQYTAARHGDTLPPDTKAPPRTMQWLVDRYLAHLTRKVDAGLHKPGTLKQRRSLLTRFCAMTDDDGDTYATLDMIAPTPALVQARDKWMDRPAEADNLIKALRAMYEWHGEGDVAFVNPARAVRSIHVSKGGAVPWTAADLRKFRDRHPAGTTAHAWLTLSLFTACRIDDARMLGRRHEVQVGGLTWLRWQPGKTGSAPVDLPVAPQLLTTLRSLKVQGASYLLTDFGKPFAYGGLGNRVRKWCADAGLENRSAHGVRKAMAELLAEAGCTQHQIMAIMSHTQAKTSEIYTKGAQRRIMAESAMAQVAGLEW